MGQTYVGQIPMLLCHATLDSMRAVKAVMLAPRDPISLYLDRPLATLAHLELSRLSLGLLLAHIAVLEPTLPTQQQLHAPFAQQERTTAMPGPPLASRVPQAKPLHLARPRATRLMTMEGVTTMSTGAVLGNTTVVEAVSPVLLEHFR